VLSTVALVVPLASAAGVEGAEAGSVTPLPAADPPREAPVLTTTTTGQEDPGLLLITPDGGTGARGAALYDNSGELVWWRAGGYQNLSQVTYRGEPALSVFLNNGTGNACLLLDSSYTEIASFSVAGTHTDGHECQYSPDGSRVLLLGWREVGRDLSAYGGPADAVVVDAVIQERDVASGEITFEWSALDHIPLEETRQALTDQRVDYVHANSLEYDSEGTLLMSARNTSTVYKIDTGTGDILWRFGGEASDFVFADPADAPSFQHDARRLADGRLSLFDNGNRREPLQSRGAVYELDERAMTAELVEDLRPAESIFAWSAGSSREQANGNHLVDFGNTGEIVEFGGPSGAEPVFTASLPDEPTTHSYRADRTTDWVGTPAVPPTVDWGAPDADGGRTLTASWNGATEVAGWRVAVGASVDSLHVLGTVPSTGFATSAEVVTPPDTEVYRVSALDAAGTVLASRTGTL
jgi:hypothetical protein